MDAVEAHGTGTSLGDPIEAQALLAAYGRDRDRPLWLGTIKSNIGHTQAAAGVAGVIKMVMAMRHGVLPKTLHADQPSPHVDWSDGPLELLTEPQAWPRTSVRRAAVSSFGVSGTNAHVIVEQAPADEPATRDDAEVLPVPVVISGHGPSGVCGQALRLRDFVRDNPDADLTRIARATGVTRAGLSHRGAVIAGSTTDLLVGLELIAQGESGPGVHSAVAAGRGATGFVFSGQGSQWSGMGRGLVGRFPVFAASFDGVCAGLESELGHSVRGVIFGGGERVDRTLFAQCGLFAVEVALARLLESWGIAADVVVGHSVGELAAAHVAGVLSLEGAVRLVCARARLMQGLPEGGAMLAVNAAEADVTAMLADLDGVGLAAVNGSSSVVVSGEKAAVEVVFARAGERGWRSKWLRVSHAFHSPLMDPMLGEFRAVAESVSFGRAVVPFVSTVQLGASPTDAGYWVRNVRDTVRFADAVAHAHELGVTRFVEVGPDAVLSAVGPESVPAGSSAVFVPVMRRQRPEPDTVANAVGQLWTRGQSIAWADYFPQRPGIDLPTYAFQHNRYWLANVEATGRRGHPLLDPVLEFAENDGFLVAGRLSAQAQPWLREHAVLGSTIVPGSVFAELALHTAAEIGSGAVSELTLQTPLALPEHGAVELQLRVGAVDDAARRPLAIYARPDSDAGTWTCHARAMLAPATASPHTELASWPPPDATALDVDSAYAEFAETGLEYGPAFRGLRAAWRRGDDIFAKAALPELGHLVDVGRYGLHPALLDAALHAMRYRYQDRPERTMLPFAWHGLTLLRAGVSALRVRLSPVTADSVRIELADSAGAPVAVVESLVVRPISAEQLGRHDALFTLEHVPTPLPDGPGPSTATCRDLAELPPGDLPEVVVLAAAQEPDVARATGRALDAVRLWLADSRFDDSRLVLCTRDAATDPAAGAVWGLIRSVQHEHPDRFVVADVDDGAVPPAAWTAEGGQLVVRDGVVSTPRLQRVPLSAPTGTPRWEPDGTVLITGGTGTLGSILARHLVLEHGVRRLVLTGRRGPDTPGAEALADELAGHGATVRIVACDIADRAAVAELLAEHPVRAVVHAAGVVDDGLVASVTAEQLRNILGPKVLGAIWLDELTRDRELTDFILFSSAAGVLGAAGQSAYGSANAALDSLARRRHAAGLPAKSLAWGLWEQRSTITGGLAAADLARIGRAGLRPLATPEALRLFDAACALNEPVLAPIRLDPNAIRANGTVPAVLRDLIREPKATPAAAGERPTAAPNGLATLLGPDREKALLTLVRVEAAGVLAYDSPADVAEQRTFAQLGVDSLAAVELRNRLSEVTGIALPAGVVFEYPTPLALAAHLHESMPAENGVAIAASVDAELDQLEAALNRFEPRELDRSQIQMRLHALLAKYGLEEAPEPDQQRDLSSASDDELFGLIDGLSAK